MFFLKKKPAFSFERLHFMTFCMVDPILGRFFRGRFSTRKGEAENMANRSDGDP